MLTLNSSEEVDQAKLDAFQVTLDLLKAAGVMIVDDVRLANFEEYIELPESIRLVL